MKRFASYLVFLLVVFFSYACNNGAGLKEENTRLTTELSKLKQENGVLQDKVNSLDKQVKDFMETPAAIYDRAQQYKAQGQYDVAIQALEKLTIKANGQPLAVKAQSEITTLKNLKAEKQRADERAKRDAFTDIGGNFEVRRISIKPFAGGGMTEVVGEMKNNSGQSYSLVNIIVSLYDAQDNLLGNAIANISNVSPSSIKSFSAYGSVPPEKVAKYKVQYENSL